MAYTRYFPTFNQVEPTLLAEESGFIVSQVKVDTANIEKKAVGDVNFIENGILCTLNASGKIVSYDTGKALFLHFDEELNTVLPGNKYFAVEIEDADDTYVRLVRLVPGSEFNSSIAPSNAVYTKAINEGKLVNTGTMTFSDGTAGYSYMCIA